MCIYRDIEYEYKTYKKYTEYNVHIQNGSLGGGLVWCGFQFAKNGFGFREYKYTKYRYRGRGDDDFEMVKQWMIHNTIYR